MRPKSHPGRLCAAVALAVAALAAGPTAPGAAQEARPAPTACAGLAFTDPAGDATAVLARESLDLRAGFLRYVTGTSGENVLTANIQVTDLQRTMEIGSYLTNWTFRWTSGSARQYVSLTLVRGGDMVFRYGTYGDIFSPRDLGRTTGRMFLGKDGIVEIVVPVAELGLEGQRLVNPHAVAGFNMSDGLHIYPEIVVDSAPDSQSGGKAFDVVPCEAELSPSTPQPAAPQPAAPPPAAPQPATPPGQPSGTRPARLNVDVIVGRQLGRRINERRTLSIGLRAGERTTALRALLMRGETVVAAGRLASLRGRGTVRLKLRANTRRLGAGIYTLQLTGRNTEGTVASRRVQVRIRR